MVDSAASMHVVSEKDLNSVELETVGISKNPTTVVGANERRCNGIRARIGFLLLTGLEEEVGAGIAARV